ncbi:MAG: hypothetical protein IPP67_09575 [Rhodospirillaceae bacterium]|nr:hypothetical protein [Rhodospirillaceae bacterium]
MHELFLQNFNRQALPVEVKKFDVLLHQFYVNNLPNYKVSPITGANEFLDMVNSKQEKFAFAFATGAMRLIASETQFSK